MADHGSIWFESGLPVSYLPRHSLVDLAAQYHRFGRWKVRYWRITGDRPLPRQTQLIIAPSILLATGAVLFATGEFILIGSSCILISACLVAIDHFGQASPPRAFPERIVGAFASLIIGSSWWSGIARESLIGRRQT